ncbi:F-box / LRR-repeat protein [Striga asiatica]|uniref:F-box / LRR-repeat protein n=1 Tax=Striga asiatica TaxID=4170 RepID=A0A5A7QT78_STRAF|nr:F-box / LRR-repeat protein [Striga asiatica]
MPHAILSCPLLRELDIASCHKLLDTSIRAAAASCPLLESLDMSNCSSIIDETIREIAMSTGNLRFLDASYCPNVALERKCEKSSPLKGVMGIAWAASRQIWAVDGLQISNWAGAHKWEFVLLW